jgi:beta-glucosidase
MNCGIPGTGNKYLQREILKRNWNFDGFVVSDWGSIKEMISHGYAKDYKQAAELAINAGSDMDMESYAYIAHLTTLVKEGKVKEATL